MAYSTLAVAEQALELGPHRRGDVLARERIGDIGGEEADLRAAVEAAAFEFEAVERLPVFASAIMASVSWISPPAPRSWFSSRSKISGCRM